MLQLGVGIRKLEFVGSVQTQQFSNYTLTKIDYNLNPMLTCPWNLMKYVIRE